MLDLLLRAVARRRPVHAVLDPDVPDLEVALRSRNRGKPHADGVSLEDSSEREFIDQSDRVVDVISLEAHPCEFPSKRERRPRSKRNMACDPSFQSSKPRGCDPVVFLFSSAPVAQVSSSCFFFGRPGLRFGEPCMIAEISSTSM